MTYENLLSDALDALPELKKEYENNLKDDIIDEDSGMHVVFGFVFEPMLSNAIKNNKPLAKKMFDYLEKMADSDDVHVQEVCDQSVLEALYGEHPAGVLWPLMQKKTREGYTAVSYYMN